MAKIFLRFFIIGLNRFKLYFMFLRVRSDTRLDSGSTVWCSVYRGISRPVNRVRILVAFIKCQQHTFHQRKQYMTNTVNHPSAGDDAIRWHLKMSSTGLFLKQAQPPTESTGDQIVLSCIVKWHLTYVWNPTIHVQSHVT